MNHRKKFSQQGSEEQSQTQAHQQSGSGPLEFGSVEEMLRHDASQTPVPPSIAVRLQDSLARHAPPPRSWWRRWFGGSEQ